MIENSFCHIPGIGSKTENALWQAGFLSWRAVCADPLGMPGGRRRDLVSRYCRESIEQLAAGNAAYFYELLPSSETWRMFPEFENWAAYVDIETTGLGGDGDYITTIALYDGLDVYTFVRGDNLDEFADFIARYRLLVTFNGKTFDVPFLRRHLGLPMDQAHIDLRYVMAGLGQRGGLKAIEKRLGLDRKDLADVDGYFAVLLWHDYRRNGNLRALETLLAYNVADVINLASIMPLAYNMKLMNTPFGASRRLPPAAVAENPFKADRETIERLAAFAHPGNT